MVTVPSLISGVIYETQVQLAPALSRSAENSNFTRCFDQGNQASVGVFGWMSWCKGPKGEFTPNHPFNSIFWSVNRQATNMCPKMGQLGHSIDDTHPLNSAFQLLSSGQRLRVSGSKTNRYWNSFVPAAIIHVNKMLRIIVVAFSCTF